MIRVLFLLGILCSNIQLYAGDEDTVKMETQTLDLSFDLSTRLDFRNQAEIPSVGFYSSWNTDELYDGRIEDIASFEPSFILFVDTLENPFTLPFKGRITSRFGWRKNRHHSGIDIDLVTGDSVVAAFDGVVRISKYYGSFGNLIIVRHYNGLETLYAHLSKLKVKPGDKVMAGDLIGLGGNTGRSTGSHLHFEIWHRGLKIDPELFIDFDKGVLTKESIMLERKLFNHSKSTSPRYLKYSVRAER